MEFKKLELESRDNGIKRFIKSRQVKRTLLGVLIGALIGFGFFYVTEGIHMQSIEYREILNSALIGGFFGFFITNSPCARNQC